MTSQAPPQLPRRGDELLLVCSRTRGDVLRAHRAARRSARARDVSGIQEARSLARHGLEVTVDKGQTSAELKILLWTYSNRSIAGCALSLLGPSLLFLGVIREGWLAITVGLYAAGTLLAPSPPKLARAITETLTLSRLSTSPAETRRRS